MLVSAIDLVRVLAEADRLMSSSLTDEQKAQVLEEIQNCLPPVQFCNQFPKTREICKEKLQEHIDGLKTTKTKGEKPKQSRARKVSAKSTKK